ncbi:TPA: hypothetical protein QH074_004341 [Enterobacter hormaechei subsp. steigerwaltii]|nr:hypothetical protein [Enterobacter hormaechei subsp. steigerwaltii]
MTHTQELKQVRNERDELAATVEALTPMGYRAVRGLRAIQGVVAFIQNERVGRTAINEKRTANQALNDVHEIAYAALQFVNNDHAAPTDNDWKRAAKSQDDYQKHDFFIEK